ncbi:MAG: heme-binding protein [Clostridia bacterium]|nr:heme-binding protein [Clostridia bacterium]
MDSKSINQIVDQVVDKIKYPDALTLDVALGIADKVKTKAAQLGVNAVIAISDKGGHPILVQSMDDAFIASYDIAVGKAYTVVSLKMSTSDLKPLAQPGGSLYGIQFTNGGKIVIFGGGEPLLNKKGEIIGGLGVSGGTEKQDTELAAFGKKIFEKGKYL